MKYLLLLPTILLTGCFWQTVNQNDIETAIRICGGIEHIVQIESTFAGTETVMCSDRSTVYMATKAVDPR